ncbi:MAG: hypothetical protein QHJ34_03420 [bacterium]|jgi:hypothetical protein|nr:hypothetical protein [candidate division KSB1 bacterium]MDH7559263.1 hypothetical protein [bacterium]
MSPSQATYVATARPEFDELYPRVRAFLEQDTLDLVIDAKPIRGYRSPDSKSIWIRDHSEMMRGFKYFERDLTSAVEHFAETQAENGRIFDFFTTVPEKLPSERENWAKYVRVPVEADVEYRFAKAAFLAWQATGDDGWICRMLPKMEKALNYVLTNPWRWDQEHQLVKRAYTVDTWDFAYTAGKHDWLQFQITGDTYWGIMHGDNSGYYQAFQIMALLHDYFGQRKRASYWRRRAREIRRRMNQVCWNGRFYTHFVKLTPVEIAGVDEAEQLSLSNPMDINRGVCTQEMAAAIIREYLRRKEQGRAFAEWYSIDPPFPDGILGDEKLVRGAYVNGGIMPLVGGELAKAALEHGFEWYGVDILRRYYQMIRTSNATYLWYFPDGTPSTRETSTSPEATPTDGWGSSAMLNAFLEGLVGVEDQLKLFSVVRLAPRWPAAGVERCEANLCYAVSGRSFAYHYENLGDAVRLNLKCRPCLLNLHLLVPEGGTASRLLVNGREMEFQRVTVEESQYVEAALHVTGSEEILLRLEAARP